MSREWVPNRKNLDLLNQCHRYYNEYSPRITTKQLFYMLVKDGVLTNDTESRRKLTSLLLRAKEHGKLDPSYSAAEEFFEYPEYLVDSDNYLEAMVENYRVPRGYLQENYLEIWTEDRSMALFLKHLFAQYDIPVLPTNEFASVYFIHSAARRLLRSAERGGAPRVLYVSDFGGRSVKVFDSLIRGLSKQLDLSVEETEAIVFRAAVLPEHIVKYDLPKSSQDAKEALAPRFLEVYGDSLKLLGIKETDVYAVESIPPDILARLLTDVVFGLVDPHKMTDVALIEEQNRQKMKKRLGM